MLANPINIHHRWQRIATALLLMSMAIGLASCVTTRQVEEIVKESNRTLFQSIDAEIVNSSAGLINSIDSRTVNGEAGLITSSEPRSGDAWKVEVERIESFISEHAEQKPMINALRLRQAWVLTVYRQDNLAEAAYDLIDASELHTDRDRAIYQLRNELIWRFMLTGNIRSVERAKMAMHRFDETNDGLPPGSEIRQYLEEMRAWISYMLTNARDDRNEMKSYLEDGLNRLADSIPDDDLKWLAEYKGKMTENDLQNMESLRLFRVRLRAIEVTRKYLDRKENLNCVSTGPNDPCEMQAGEMQIEPNWDDDKTRLLVEAASD